MPLYKLQLPHNLVTLSESQGHSHWYQNVESSCAYYQTKCEKKGVWTEATFKHIFYKLLLSFEY